jgi:hypothetical protein
MMTKSNRLLLTSLLVVAHASSVRAGEHQDGIKVHGHWTIEVRNPDGKLVTHREFENSLDPQTGATGLANVLGRVHSVGLWEVGVGNLPTLPAQPCQASTFMSPCIMGESGDTLNPNAFKTLSVTVPTSGNNAGKVVLSGSFTAQNTSPLAAASSTFFYCPGTVAPVNCGTPLNQFTFLTATFFSAITVNAGQLVQVTVVISFS